MVATVADELRSRGERPAVLPFGGSNALAARGYLACATELEEQAPGSEHVVEGGGFAAVGYLGGPRNPKGRPRVSRPVVVGLGAGATWAGLAGNPPPPTTCSLPG